MSPRQRALVASSPSLLLLVGSLVWAAIDARVPQRAANWLIHW